MRKKRGFVALAVIAVLCVAADTAKAQYDPSVPLNSIYHPEEKEAIKEHCNPDSPAFHVVLADRQDDGKNYPFMGITTCTPKTNRYLLMILCNTVQGKCRVLRTSHLAHPSDLGKEPREANTPAPPKEEEEPEDAGSSA